MKKAIIGLGSLLLFLSTTIQAQNVDFGVTTGFQVSVWAVDEVPSSIGRLGFLIGGHASIFLNERIVIKSGLLLSQKGTWLDLEDINSEDTHALTSDYLSLPILAKLYITKGLHVQAGPQFSYLIASAAKIGTVKTENGNLKQQRLIRPVDAGMVFGLGYEFQSTFTFAINFDISFVNLIKDADAFEERVREEFPLVNFDGEFPERTRNGALQFVFSYNFTKNRSAF